MQHRRYHALVGDAFDCPDCGKDEIWFSSAQVYSFAEGTDDDKELILSVTFICQECGEIFQHQCKLDYAVVALPDRRE